VLPWSSQSSFIRAIVIITLTLLIVVFSSHFLTLSWERAEKLHPFYKKN
jgi:hypothetical protein